MRRLLAALLALSLAIPAQAGRVLVIKQASLLSGQAANAVGKQLATIESVLDALGVDYDLAPQTYVRSCLGCPGLNDGQQALITGKVGLNSNPVASEPYKQYAGIIHMGFTVAGNGGSGTNSRVAGYNPDTLTLCRNSGGVPTTWPQIPQLFLGSVNISSGGAFASTATCSTGVAGGVAANTSVKADLAFRLVGQPEVWKSGAILNANAQHAYWVRGASGLTILSTTPGITKSRVVYGGTASAVRDSGSYFCNDCDSLFTPVGTYFSSPASDTSIIWTRERYNGDTAPLIFALPTSVGGGGSGDHTLLAMAVAIMDSATGGQIIGQKPNWVPPKMGFVVSGAFTHSYSQSSFSGVTSSFDWNVHGGTPADTTYLKQGIDSLASLRVPVLITVNVDSVDSYPNEKSWWSRIPDARFSPESRVYTDSLNANGGETNSSQYLFPDVFGIYRSRQLITANRFQYGTTCGSGDTTLSCLLYFMRQRLDSIPEFRGKMSSAIMAPWFDYIPRNFNRNAMPDPDSFAVALSRSGFNTAINGTMHIYSTPSASWGAQSGSPFSVGQPTFSPGTWYPNPRTQVVKAASGATMGHLKWLNMRHFDEDVFGSVATSHEIMGEIWVGFFLSPWYLGDTPYWNHAMRARLNLVVIRPADLGNSVAGGSIPVASRPGWYFIKYAVNQIRAINKLAGRTVIAIAYPEDIEPQ